MKTPAPHLDRARHDNCSYNRGCLAASFWTLVALLLAWILTALPATAAPTFSVSEVNSAGGYHNYGIATGDFNRDGRPDLVMVSAVLQQIFVFLNHGGGDFDPAVSFPSDNPDRQLQAVAVADMNGDGNLDVVAIDERLEEAVVFLGRGDGTFTVGHGFPCGSAHNRHLVIADFNEDGRMDVVSLANGISMITAAAASLLLGNGDGTLGPATTFIWPSSGRAMGSAIAVADFNRDGHMDLAIADNSSPTVIFLGRGDGTFMPGTVIPADPGNWHALAVGDLNGDGISDLVGVALLFPGGYYLPKVVVALGHGDGTFAEVVQYSLRYNQFAGITVADFDGGGADIAVTGDDGQVEILLGRGDGSFRNPNPSYDLGGPRADNLLVADLDGDGLPDLAVATQQATTINSGLITLRNATLLRLGSLRLLAPPTAELGGRTSVTVSAYDQFGRPFPEYRGTVQFLTSDTASCFQLPADYTFTAADSGSHLFDRQIALMSAGAQTITVRDSVSPTIQASQTILISEGLTVTTTADVVTNDGQVSLREAIQFANALARPVDNPAIIRFNICDAPPGALVIKPLSELPPIRSFTVVDGYSQPGSSSNTLVLGNDAVRRIVLDGSLAGSDANGLTLEKPVQVRGLVIVSFSGSGIYARKTGGDVIQGNEIRWNAANGVTLEQGNCLVGGALPADRNFIFGNVSAGIWMGRDTSGNLGHRIEGNHIGTVPNGTSPYFGQALGGIVIFGCSNTVVGGSSEGQRNVISGNDGPGIVVTGDSRDTMIRANYLGLSAAGDVALGNNSGIIISNAIRTVIGGGKFSDGNVISGNLLHGLVLAQGARETSIRANRIGTKPAGNASLPNGGDGIVVLADAADNQVGGGSALTANVISGNQANGIRLSGGTRTTILGNFIGTALGGIAPLGNLGSGIAIAIDSVVSGAPDENNIGATIPGAGNVIAYNSQAGVIAKTGFNNSIRGNSIHDNMGLGIDLGGDSVTLNDPGDGDAGPNELQNYPVLLNAVSDGVNVTLMGTMAGAPGVRLDLDFYWNTGCHAAGFGEGRTYLGSGLVITDPTGNAVFSNRFSTFVPIGAVVTATATTAAGNTSEFSPCQLVASAGVGWVFDGLDYRALGSAVVAPTGDMLEASNLGSSGGDGLEVTLGNADGWRGHFLWPAFTNGGFHLATTISGKNGTGADHLVGASLYEIDGTVGSFTADFSALASLKSRLELRDADGVIVASGIIDNATPLKFSAIGSKGQAGMIVPENLIAKATLEGGAISLQFSEDVFINNLPKTVHQSPDIARMRTLCITGLATLPVEYISLVGLQVALPPPEKGAPTGVFQVAGWDLSAFDHFHHPGGANILAKEGVLPENFLLTLRNPVLGGPATTDIELGPVSQSRLIWLDFDPVDVPTDASLRLDFLGFTGGANGGHNLPVGEIILRKTGLGIELASTMTPWNGPLVRMKILSAGKVIFDDLLPLNQSLAMMDGWPVGVEAGIGGDDSIYGILIGLLFPADRPAVFTIGGKIYAGDALQISAGQPTAPIRYLESATLEFNLSQMSITAETTAPAVIPPLTINNQGGKPGLLVATEAGRRYRLLSGGGPHVDVWDPFSAFVGDGTIRSMSLPSPLLDGAGRYFRLWAE